MTPYKDAINFIHRYPGTGSSIGMAKLILSIYNPIHSFGFADCVRSFDKEGCKLAEHIVTLYMVNGEDDELREVGYEIYKKFPSLVELSNAADKAKAEVDRHWRIQYNARHDPELT